LPDRGCRRRLKAFADQGGISSLDKVACRVGNGPIEVENDCGPLNGIPLFRPPSASRTRAALPCAILGFCDEIEPRFGSSTADCH